VRGKRFDSDKPPWKALPGPADSLERQFIRPRLVGDSLLPLRLRAPQEAIIP
jgi:hypothetical protein